MDMRMIIFGTKEIGFIKLYFYPKSSAKINLAPVEVDEVSSSLSLHNPLRLLQEEYIPHF